MSIYTAQQLIEVVEKMSLEEAKSILVQLIHKQLPKSAAETVGRLIMKDTERVSNMKLIGDNRAVTLSSLVGLSTSPIMRYIPALIEAALDPRGPHQTREIAMIADQLAGGGAPWITEKGIGQHWKNQIGYVLTMAGFDRDSHYDRLNKKPIKAWKLRAGWGHYTLDQRIEIVYATIQQATTPGQQPQPSTPAKAGLGSYL